MGRIKPVYRRFIFYILLMLLVFSVYQCNSNSATSNKTISLIKQEAIINKAKVSITPLITVESLELYITIESYENQLFTKENPKNFFLIMLDDTVVPINEWKIKNQSDNFVEGKLTLTPHQLRSDTALNIELFLEDSTRFSWNVNLN